jgi:predicted  nucleic acid-binding Zn-ribbon protein
MSGGEAPPQTRFGIERAIELMRSLPTEQNPDLVAMAIARTLAAVNVPVSHIIEDATSRQKDLEAKLGTARAACTALETEIELHVDEIVELEAYLAEAMSVVERLEHVRHAPS